MPSDGIYPPHKIFYLESLASVTTNAVMFIDGFFETHNAIVNRQGYDQDELFRCIQGIVSQSGGLSKYFWPPYIQDQDAHARARARARDLKNLLGISDNSPLKDRRIRNSVEHFDERLDDFVSRYPVGNIHPQLVCLRERIFSAEVPTYAFLAYHPDTISFSVLGDEIELEILIKEIVDIHGKVVTAIEGG